MTSDELELMLQNVAPNLEASGAALQETMKKLREATAAVANNTAEGAGKFKDSVISAAGSVAKFAVNTTHVIASMSSITSSAYGLDKAFTSVIPTFDQYMNSMTKVFDALGKLGSGVSILGFATGRATEGLSAVAKMGLDVVGNIIKFQLETAQKVADIYTEMSKSGATFGGSINNMAQSAADAGLPIQNFAKLIMSNTESLAKFGKSFKDGAVFVGGLGTEILNTNTKLAVLYGGVDGLNEGIAQYIALQSQLGIDETKDRSKAKEGAIEYLMRQKELSQITGKNAETLRKEEEGRRKQLDYNLKMGRLGEVAQQNVKEGMAVAGKLFGDQGSKYAEEYFATGGKIFSKEALTYQAMNREAADAISQLVTGVDQSRESYRKGVGNYLSANADTLEGVARSQEAFAEINRAANNPILRSMTETSSSVLENLNLMKNYSALAAQIEKDRTTKPGPASEGYAEALKMARDSQIKIDGMVLENMNKMSDMVNFLYKTQSMFIENQAGLTRLFNSLSKGDAIEFANALEEIAKFMAKRFFSGLDLNITTMPPAPANTIPRPNDENPLLPPTQNMPGLTDILNRLLQHLQNNPTPPAGQPQGQGGPFNPVATMGTLLDQQTVEQHTALLTNMERNTSDANTTLGRILTALS
jgi:hypothetical protein